ncbi:MAG: hypothetical protein IKF14_13200 [Atopobiaceae bacterium]|nr:hypothetical protein [Atopobiaceae bacterium]
MYAFISHTSACEALRLVSSNTKRWPKEPRPLPKHGDCVSTQRGFIEFCAKTDLKELGITSQPTDLIVPSSRDRSRGRQATFHVWSRNLPANSLLWLGNNLLVSGPELTILQLCGTNVKLDALLDDFAKSVHAEIEIIASIGLDEKPVLEIPLNWERIRSLVVAAVVACEFAGTYRLPVGNKDTNYEAVPLMSCRSLETMARSMGSRSMERRAIRASQLAFDHSKSPMETALALMLTLPVEMGGFGLPRPVLNKDLDVSKWRGHLSDRDTVCPDMWWEDDGVALEYDSAAFHGGSNEAKRTNDAIRSNILTSLGYATFRVTPSAIASLQGATTLAHQIAARMGIELVSPDNIGLQRRTKLFTELMPKSTKEA